MNSLCRFDSFCRFIPLLEQHLQKCIIVSNHEIRQRGGDIEAEALEMLATAYIDIEECHNPKASLGAKELQPKLTRIIPTPNLDIYDNASWKFSSSSSNFSTYALVAQSVKCFLDC